MHSFGRAIVAAAVLLTAGSVPAAPADTLTLSLEGSVKAALESNTDLRIALERLREAKERIGEAGAAFLPQISGSAAYTRLDVAPYIPTARFGMLGGPFSPVTLPDRITLGLVDNYAAGLTLQQPIYTAGKLTGALAMSRLAHQAAQSEYEGERITLVFEVTRAYLECVKALSLGRVAEESVRRLEAHERDVESMREAGLAAENDVLKARTYVSEARLARVRAAHAVRLASTYLASIIDAPLSTEIVFTTAVGEAPPVAIDLEAAIERGAANRAEIKALECRTDIARKEIDMNRRGHVPELALVANLAWKNPNREYESDFYSSWTVALQAQMNVFDWGKVSRRTAQARSRLAQAETAASGARSAVALDITRAYLTLLEAQQEIGVSRESVASAEENRRVTEERFAEGLATSTELLDAHLLLTRAKTEHEAAIVNCRIARADLERAMGGPID